MAMLVTNRLLTLYRERVAPLLMDEFKYKNPNLVPRIKDIVLKPRDSETGSETVKKDLTLITGQKAIQKLASQDNGPLNIRKGDPLEVAAKLTGNAMYSFLDRLLTMGFPKTRDFKGIGINCFDKKGNCRVGLVERSVLAQSMHDPASKFTETDIYINTTAKTDREAHRLLALMGIPFAGGARPKIREKRKMWYYQGKVQKAPAAQ